MIKDLILSGDQKAIEDYLAIALEGVEQPLSERCAVGADEGCSLYLFDWSWREARFNGLEGLVFIAPENNHVDLVDEFLSYKQLDSLYNEICVSK